MTQQDKDRVAICRSQFESLLSTVDRDGTAELLQWLAQETDFYTAPATVRLIRNYPAGLCEQALVRYENLKSLVKISNLPYSDATIVLVSLLAGLSKVNYFELVSKNKKVYDEAGSKHDELGNFEWVAELSYDIRDPDERYAFGTAGQNAERLITSYIPLTDEESAAIVNFGVDFDNPGVNLITIYKRYPLALLLQMAENLATFIDTKDQAEGVPF